MRLPTLAMALSAFSAALLLALTACSDRTATDTIALAEQQIEAGDHEAALRTLDARLENGGGLDDGASARLHFLRARSREAVGREYDALYDYEHIIRNHPASDQYRPAVEREFEVARLILSGAAAESIARAGDSPDEMAEELLIRTVERLPGSGLARDAMYELLTHYLRTGDRQSAEAITSVMQRQFPGDPKTKQAGELLAQNERQNPPPNPPGDP